MNSINTRYGNLVGISHVEYYDDGNLKECTLNSPNELETSCGLLTPQYEESGIRSKHIGSLSFYPNGNMRSISLQKQTDVNTPIGVIPAELITFYESGNMKRIFPLNGKITAYWTEKDEYKLSREIDFNLSVGTLREKVIAIHFYEGGTIKSLTFWNDHAIVMNSPLGKVSIRIGVSFYENGKIKSLEPKRAFDASTKIGTIKAYNTEAMGIHGDSNSLEFSEKGEVKSVVTSTDSIEITNISTGEKQVYRPLLRRSIINENSMEVIPLNIGFNKDLISFSNGMQHKFFKEYNINEWNFSINQIPLNINSPCSSCNGNSTLGC